jgi:hypothetical protein
MTRLSNFVALVRFSGRCKREVLDWKSPSIIYLNLVSLVFYVQRLQDVIFGSYYL